MRSRRGLSLLEIVFCCALLGLLMSVVTQLVVSAYRTQSLYRDRLERQRSATVFLQKLVRQLQGASDVRILSTGLAPTVLTELTGNGLVLTHTTPDGPRSEYYYRNDDAKEVRCEQFGASFVYTVLATWVPLPGFPRVEVRQAQAFSIEPITLGPVKLWRLKLKVEGLPHPYTRQVRRQPTEGL